MKPISVRFKCFGPYMEEQYINFEELGNKGIFLICGETGSGKTTILDAICIALYGKASGGMRGELEDMRCKSANRENTFVEYIFSSGNNTYRFFRELKYARKNLNDSYEVGILRDGEFEPVASKINKTVITNKAKEIIGLDYDQFCQVVILPQGKFEQLLTSESDNKEIILKTLFNMDKWDTLLARMKKTVDDEKKEIDSKYQAIKGRLEALHCGNLEELSEIINDKTQCQHDQEQRLKEIKDKKEKSENTYIEATRIEDQFELLDRSKKDLSSLENQKETNQENKIKKQNAEKAALITKSYEDYIKAQKEFNEKQNKVIKAQEELNVEKDKYEQAQKDDDNHKKEKSQYDKARDDQIKLNNAIPVYENIETKNKELIELKKKAEQKGKIHTETLNNLNKAKETWENARRKNNDAVDQYSIKSNAYNENIAGILAQKLENNKCCPVCGSLIHPNPAKLSENCVVTEEDVKKANDNVLATSKKFAEASDEKAKAETEESTAADELHAIEKIRDDILTEIKTLEGNGIKGINNLEELQQQIKIKDDFIKQYDETEKTVSDTLSNAKDDYTAKEAELKLLANQKEDKQKELEKAELIWTQALERQGFKNEEEYSKAVLSKQDLENLTKDISAYEINLQNAQTHVTEQLDNIGDAQRPDMEKLELEKNNSEKDFTDETLVCSGLETEIKNLNSNYDDLTLKWDEYLCAKQESDKRVEFINKLNNNNGINLTRYVLGIMMASVITAANQLLENVHGGRYQLVRRNDATGRKHKSGLELDSFDRYNNEKRSVKSLSGGEKFLVSLCLAIGLSTVVQAQSGGQKLEAMFVDEGFGSLDDESINDALNVLQSTHKGNGIVGIISHVDKLAETIPTKIHVIKNEKGNHLECEF